MKYSLMRAAYDLGIMHLLCFDRHPKRLNNSVRRTIIHINKSRSRGGAAAVMNGLIESQRRMGHEAIAMTAKEIKQLRFGNSISRFMVRVLVHIEKKSSWLDTFRLHSLLLRKNATFITSEIIHLHNLHGGYFSMLALPILCRNKKTILTLHDMYAFTGHCTNSLECRKWKIGCRSCKHLDIYPAISRDSADRLWQIKKAVFDRIEGICVISPSKWMAEMARESILSKYRIVVVQNGVDKGYFRTMDKTASRIAVGLPVDKNIIIYIAVDGFHNALKGGRIAREVSQLCAGYQQYHFVCLGETGTSRPGLQFTPFIDKKDILAMYLSSADVLLYPTLADNCPLVVLESLSVGTPVVAANIGGLTELINPNVNGQLVASQEPQKYMDAIVACIDMRIRDCAHEDVSWHVNSLEDVALAYSEVYDQTEVATSH